MLARRFASFFLLAWWSWLTLQAGNSAAQGLGERGTPVSLPALPFTESIARMAQRDRLLRQQRLAGRLPRGVVAPVPRQSEEARPFTPAGGSDEAPFPAPRDPAVRASAGPLAQSVGTSFDGIGFQDQADDLVKAVYPPDPSGAMGLDHFVLMTNNSVAFYNREGQRLLHGDADVFFSAGSFPRNGGVNPRVLYDRYSARWFATLIERGDPIFTGNNIGLAVSRTPNPFGPWDKYVLPLAVPSAPGVSYYIDYATLGVDRHAVTLGYTVRASDGSGSTARIATTRIAPLVDTPPSLGQVFVFSDLPDFHTAPLAAHNPDAGTPYTVVVGTPYQAFANVVYRRINWVGSPGNPLLSESSTVNTPDYVPPDFPPVHSLGSNTRVDVGDDRLQTAVIRSGRLWTCRTVGLGSAGTAAAPDRVGCEWLVLTVAGTSLTLEQSGRRFDSSAVNPRSYYYPSVMPNGQGHAAMGFSGSRGTEYIGAYAAGRLAGEAPGTMRSLQSPKPGEGPYELLDSQGKNRWGDYSYTSLDPRDDMSLWTLQTYAAPQGPPFNGVVSRWKTRVAQLKAPAPMLNSFSRIVRAGDTGSILLSGSGFYDPGVGFSNPLRHEVTGGAVNGFSGSLDYISPSTVELSYEVSELASPGPRDLTVINPDGQSVTLVGAFTVLAPTHFSAATYSTVEPVSGTSTVTVTVERDSAAADNTESVVYSTDLNVGTAGLEDYTPVAGSLEFQSGETQKTFTVPIRGDRLLEETEEFGLFLAQGLKVIGEARVSISDNPVATAPENLQATAVSGRIDLEWRNRCDNETFTHRIERKTGAGNFALLAMGGLISTYSDVGVTPGTQYTYRVRVEKGALVTPFSNEATATVPSSPTTVQLAQSYHGASEGGAVVVTVTRTGDVSGSSSVTLSISPNTATAGTDYTGSDSTVNFQANESLRTLFIPLLADNLIEADETLSLSLINPQGAALGAIKTASAVILDDRAATAPANLQAERIGPNRWRLSWTDRCGNEEGFRLEELFGEFQPVQNVTGTETFVDVAPTSQDYTYRVIAIASSGRESGPSPEMTFSWGVSGTGMITPRKLSFGTLKLGKSKTLKVTIQNTTRTTQSLYVNVGTLPGPYTITGGGPFTLARGQKRVVTVLFQPTTAGSFPAVLHVSSNSLNVSTRSVEIRVTGKGR